MKTPTTSHERGWRPLRVLLPLLCTGLVLGGCGKPSPVQDSRAVSLDVQTGALTGDDATKTAYTHTDESGGSVGSTSLRERIDWVKGDVIRVYCPQATVKESSEPWADYAVTGYTSVSNYISRAAIKPVGNGLLWGTGKHVFYGMYPAPSDAPSGFSYTNGAMQAVIPATQAVTHATGSSAPARWYPSDMRYATLLAASDPAGVDPPSSDNDKKSVRLPFYPQYTAFDFEVFAGQHEQVTIEYFELVREEGSIAGTYTVPLGQYYTGDNRSAAEAAVTVSGGASTIRVSFTGGVTVKRSEGAVRFTVLTLPKTHTGLTIRFKLQGEENVRSLRLKTAAGVDVEFIPYRKYGIRGLSFPVELEALIHEPINWGGWIDVLTVDPILWNQARLFLPILEGVDWDN